MLSRDIGTNYARVTGGLDYSKTVVAPGGIEVKPFANARYDYFNIKPEDRVTHADNTQAYDAVKFGRTIGQAGVDIRYPFIKSSKNVDLIIEPRAQITQSFGDGKHDKFAIADTNNNSLSLFQDGVDVDFDQALLWQPNKSTGYDFWQKGLRADVGASVIAEFEKSRAQLFVGRSYSQDITDNFAIGSGLENGTSDLVGQFEVDLNNKFNWTTRVRYDDTDSKFRRIDTGFSYSGRLLSTSWRYYKLDPAARLLTTNPDAPPQSISGNVRMKLNKNWSVSYSASRDLDEKVTRNQTAGLSFRDDCTLIELLYTRNNFNNDAIRNNNGISVRVSLLTLGDFSNK